jgi:hypothetical protein
MKCLEVSGAVRPLKWPLGVKWLIKEYPACTNKTLSLFYCLVICLERLSRTTKTSGEVVGFSAEIRSLHLPNSRKKGLILDRLQ